MSRETPNRCKKNAMTNFRLYNTLTRTKEEFVPLDPKNVRMYVCGPTVYDYAHIGNARPAIVFDVLFRLLRHLYGEDHVTYVRNVTDIDDKINARALERRGDRNVPILDVVRELTNETYGVYQQDMAALGNLPPTHMPRATENVGHMIAMIERLIAAGHAYEASGHVLFDVLSKPDYGKLSRRSLDDMIAGARVEVAPYKKNPMDFVLWKPSDASTPGWDSPWGRGRPGWHIECSSMIETGFAGIDTIDIHGGGIDLVFPHHENEIAQSEGAHRDHPLARYWMHNGFLNVEGDKMSKSLGNFVTIDELLNTYNFGNTQWDARSVRFAMLSTHYRQPIDWTEAKLYDAIAALKNFKLWGEKYPIDKSNVYPPFLTALLDDLNTPQAITELFALYRRIKADRISDPAQDNRVRMLSNSLGLLGISDLSDFRGARIQFVHVLSNEEIVRATEARLTARKAKNFKESDRIRDELAAQGIVLKDNPDGTTSWEVKR
jgi:cysteinyl-tRNA synthetase